MPSTRCLRRLAAAGGACVALSLSTAFADGPPTASISRPDAPERATAPPRTKPAATPTESGYWWVSSAGIAAALAVFGGISIASKRFLPSGDSGPIQVVGRSALSTKHSVYLLRVGERVLILGTGPQGAPSTLGEVTDPAELARLAPRRTPRPANGPVPVVPVRPSTGFDRRIGDDE